MPTIAPPGGPVDWPEGEGTLGVVGVAPWATLDFCRALYALVPASKDWHFPRLLVDLNPKIPSRGRHLELGETDPSDAIRQTIAELAAAGATLAVVVCNTAHILHDRWAKDAPIPILHIVDETLAECRLAGAGRVAPLVSRTLARADLYGARGLAQGLGVHRLAAEDQVMVERFIEEIKVAGALGEESARRAADLFDRLAAAGVDTVIGGCTELSGLAELPRPMGLRFVDSNVALARAALTRLGARGA